jgi:hypothetical protein
VKHLWQVLLERLWPSRGDSPTSQSRRTVLLQAVVALAITLAWGPEITAAMEMTALLELLGVGFFLTAYGAGFRLKTIECSRALQSIVLPLGQLVVIRSDAKTSLKALAAASVIINAAWCVGAAVVVCAYGHHMLKLVS